MREDWVEVKLNRISQYTRGVSYKKEQSSTSSHYDMLPILRANNINKIINFDELVYVQKDLIDNDKLLKENDILFAMSSGSKHLVGKSARVSQDLNYAFGAFCGVVRPIGEISGKYIAYYFQTNKYRKYISEISSGTNINNLKKDDLLDLIMPIPPLLEQKAIVAKIEQLFSELDNAVANLKTAKAKLKIYRQAVLKKAFEGELTKEWKYVELEEIAEVIAGYAFKSQNFKSDIGKYQVIKIGNVRPGVIRLNESPAYIDDIEPKVSDKFLLKINDVVITLIGTRTKQDYGYTALINKDSLLLNQRLAYFRFLPNYNSKFFLYYSWTKMFKTHFFSFETGNVGQGNVGMKAILKVKVPLCSLEKQNQIVQEIESRLSVCDKIEETIETSLAKSEALRQSILKKAFEEKLLNEQELENIKNHPEYESADKLLERIKKERKS